MEGCEPGAEHSRLHAIINGTAAVADWSAARCRRVVAALVHRTRIHYSSELTLLAASFSSGKISVDEYFAEEHGLPSEGGNTVLASAVGKQDTALADILLFTLGGQPEHELG